MGKQGGNFDVYYIPRGLFESHRRQHQHAVPYAARHFEQGQLFGGEFVCTKVSEPKFVVRPDFVLDAERVFRGLLLSGQRKHTAELAPSRCRPGPLALFANTGSIVELAYHGVTTSLSHFFAQRLW